MLIILSQGRVGSHRDGPEERVRSKLQRRNGCITQIPGWGQHSEGREDWREDWEHSSHNHNII